MDTRSLVRLVMSLYQGVKTRFGVEFEVRMGMHQGSVLSLFLFAVVEDVATELARNGLLR